MMMKKEMLKEVLLLDEVLDTARLEGAISEMIAGPMLLSLSNIKHYLVLHEDPLTGDMQMINVALNFMRNAAYSSLPYNYTDKLRMGSRP